MGRRRQDDYEAHLGMRGLADPPAAQPQERLSIQQEPVSPGMVAVAPVLPAVQRIQFTATAAAAAQAQEAARQAQAANAQARAQAQAVNAGQQRARAALAASLAQQTRLIAPVAPVAPQAPPQAPVGPSLPAATATTAPTLISQVTTPTPSFNITAPQKQTTPYPPVVIVGLPAWRPADVQKPDLSPDFSKQVKYATFPEPPRVESATTLFFNELFNTIFRGSKTTPPEEMRMPAAPVQVARPRPAYAAIEAERQVQIAKARALKEEAERKLANAKDRALQSQYDIASLMNVQVTPRIIGTTGAASTWAVQDIAKRNADTARQAEIDRVNADARAASEAENRRVAEKAARIAKAGYEFKQQQGESARLARVAQVQREKDMAREAATVNHNKIAATERLKREYAAKEALASAPEITRRRAAMSPEEQELYFTNKKLWDLDKEEYVKDQMSRYYASRITEEAYDSAGVYREEKVSALTAKYQAQVEATYDRIKKDKAPDGKPLKFNMPFVDDKLMLEEITNETLKRLSPQFVTDLKPYLYKGEMYADGCDKLMFGWIAKMISTAKGEGITNRELVQFAKNYVGQLVRDQGESALAKAYLRCADGSISPSERLKNAYALAQVINATNYDIANIFQPSAMAAAGPIKILKDQLMLLNEQKVKAIKTAVGGYMKQMVSDYVAGTEETARILLASKILNDPDKSSVQKSADLVAMGWLPPGSMLDTGTEADAKARTAQAIKQANNATLTIRGDVAQVKEQMRQGQLADALRKIGVEFGSTPTATPWPMQGLGAETIPPPPPAGQQITIQFDPATKKALLASLTMVALYVAFKAR
jgi:hypothetical protein